MFHVLVQRGEQRGLKNFTCLTKEKSLQKEFKSRQKGSPSKRSSRVGKREVLAKGVQRIIYAINKGIQQTKVQNNAVWFIGFGE